MTKGKVAFITGAASGIGLALTKELLSKGWTVALVDYNGSGAGIAAELGSSAAFYKCDVSSWESQESAFEAVYNDFGHIDFVAANAGIDDKFPFYEKTEKPVKPDLKTVDVDLAGVLYSLYLAAFYFRKNGTAGGRFVATASMAGIYPFPVCPQYAACKAGVINLVRSVARVYERENIFVNAVCPAFVKTGLAPAGLLAAIPKEHYTPIETIVRGYMSFIESDRTGQAAECSLDEIHYREHSEFGDASVEFLMKPPNDLKIWYAGYFES